jgi:hypothetical protein
MGRIFLANIGVNAAHRLYSPLYEDGSFTLVTIPEDRDLPGMVRYGEVPALRAVVPEKYWGHATHYDPEFETRTYGDNCGWAPRAAALKACLLGDWIFFIARLVGADGPVFAVVGCLEIEAILSSVRRPPAEPELARFGANAHVRRALADPAYWDGFWVFAGGPSSRAFDRALLVGRQEAEVLLRNRAGGPWDWRANRTELQTIGSYTRSCRCVIDPELDPVRAEQWWTLLHDRVGFAPWQSHSRPKPSQLSST